MKRKEEQVDEDDGSDSDSKNLIDVDFDFFDPIPTDYIALKRMLVQLFQADAELLHLHELTELVLSQPLLGTTVKTDEIESDPYAFLTVLNLNVHRDNASIKALTEYALSKATLNPTFHQALHALLGTEGLKSSKHVGLLLTERLVNMPVQVVPHMYRMLSDEIRWALDDKEPYDFEYFIYISRIYRLTAEDENAMEGVEPTGPPAKRQKAKKGGAAPRGPSTNSFHPEDEVLQKHALFSVDYDFTKRQPRGEDAFGLDTAGRLMLLPAAKLKEVIEEMAATYTVPT